MLKDVLRLGAEGRNTPSYVCFWMAQPHWLKVATLDFIISVVFYFPTIQGAYMSEYASIWTLHSLELFKINIYAEAVAFRLLLGDSSFPKPV